MKKSDEIIDKIVNEYFNLSDKSLIEIISEYSKNMNKEEKEDLYFSLNKIAYKVIKTM